MPSKEHVTWNDISDFIKHKIEPAHADKQFTGVFGVPRGGVCLAVMISHCLNIPMLAAPAPGCLIVDDICDSGESLIHYFKNSSGEGRQDYTIATLYYKENALGVVPDIYSKIKEDKWVVFPWEAF